ncbi:VOC family protein [Confluentibacter citreus]|uniref:glyoxalase family protein n=1 Tax=Confluentibacter citreus TaxID=2007307 RepID=UPI000C295450|nr:glyoxalase family protein [Confluentibacter citreus]
MKNNQINYIEFKAPYLEEIKAFYSKCFNWVFTYYGPNYIAFSESGLDGGFEKSDSKIINGVLVVLYHEDLSLVKNNVVQFAGIISKDIFSFLGGRRFQFLDPAGNELAVWSDK